MGENSATENVIGLLNDKMLPAPGVDVPLKHHSMAFGMLERLDLLQESVLLTAKYIGALDFDMPADQL